MRTWQIIPQPDQELSRVMVAINLVIMERELYKSIEEGPWLHEEDVSILRRKSIRLKTTRKTCRLLIKYCKQVLGAETVRDE